MVYIDNEAWVLLADGRLISLNRKLVDRVVGQGGQLIPSERVAWNASGTGFVLLPEPEAPAASAEAAPETEPEGTPAAAETAQEPEPEEPPAAAEAAPARRRQR